MIEIGTNFVPVDKTNVDLTEILKVYEKKGYRKIYDLKNQLILIKQGDLTIKVELTGIVSFFKFYEKLNAQNLLNQIHMALHALQDFIEFTHQDVQYRNEINLTFDGQLVELLLDSEVPLFSQLISENFPKYEKNLWKFDENYVMMTLREKTNLF